MSKVDWLDRLTFREIELVNEVCPIAIMEDHVILFIRKRSRLQSQCT